MKTPSDQFLIFFLFFSIPILIAIIIWFITNNKKRK